MTMTVVSRRTTPLSERIDLSILSLHTLPGLDARAVARVIGVPARSVRASYWLHRHSSVRSSVARLRVESAERLLRSDPAVLPASEVLDQVAEAVGFRSVDEMDRAFLRLRRRSSFDVLLGSRAVSPRAAA